MAYQKYRAALLKKYNHCCAWCGTVHNLQIDHVQTQSTGGGDNFDNLQILCGSCNRFKSKWVLPKLEPREPQLDQGKIRRRQHALRYKIMPHRRNFGAVGTFLPKKEREIAYHKSYAKALNKYFGMELF